MTFKEFLDSNPAAKAEYDTALAKAEQKGMETARAEMKAITDKVMPILKSTEYSQTVKECGIKAIAGEQSIATFDAVVVIADADMEKAKAKAAEGESGKQGETPPVDSGEMSADPEAIKALENKKKRMMEGV